MCFGTEFVGDLAKEEEMGRSISGTRIGYRKGLQERQYAAKMTNLN